MLFKDLNPRGSAVYKNSASHCFLGRAAQAGTVAKGNGRQAISMQGKAVADGQVPLSAPSKKRQSNDCLFYFS